MFVKGPNPHREVYRPKDVPLSLCECTNLVIFRNVRCDICINNTLALSNTQMLADYAALDPRMRVMGYVIKWWAKARKINEPYSGTLSSYALLLMIVNFLQMRQPPVLVRIRFLFFFLFNHISHNSHSRVCSAC